MHPFQERQVDQADDNDPVVVSGVIGGRVFTVSATPALMRRIRQAYAPKPVLRKALRVVDAAPPARREALLGMTPRALLAWDRGRRAAMRPAAAIARPREGRRSRRIRPARAGPDDPSEPGAAHRRRVERDLLADYRRALALDDERDAKRGDDGDA